MSKLPVSYTQVPKQSIEIFDKLKVSKTYRMIQPGVLGNLTSYNHFYPIQKRLSYTEVLEALPNYNGKLTVKMVNTLLLKYDKLDIGCSIFKNDEVKLTNPTNRTLSKWAIFKGEDQNLAPIKIDFANSHRQIVDKDELILTLDIDMEHSSKDHSISKLNIKDNNHQISILEDHKINTLNKCKEWFRNNKLIDVPGDGKCGAHALFHALQDIKLDIDFDKICQELEFIELKRNQERPELNGWWSAETLRTFCEQLGVNLLIHDVSLGTDNYWWTNLNVILTIGIWANGNHYQWYQPIKYKKLIFEDTKSILLPKRKNSIKSVSFDLDSIKKSVVRNNRSNSNLSIERFDLEFSDERINDSQSYDDQPVTIILNDLTSEIQQKYIDMGFDKNDIIIVPEHFDNFVRDYEVTEIDITYNYPEIKEDRRKNDIHAWLPFDHVTTHMPKRMDAPLLRMPDSFIETFKTNNLNHVKFVHTHWRSSIQATLKSLYNDKLLKSDEIPYLTNNINILKLLCRQHYLTGSEILGKTALACAYDFTMNDNSIISGEKINPKEYICDSIEYSNYLNMILILRHLLVQSTSSATIRAYNYEFHRYHDGRFLFKSLDEKYNFKILGLGSLFLIQHDAIKEIFIGTSTYFDYTLTYVEVRQNLRIIRSSAEYSWIRELSNLFIELSESHYDHNLCVLLFKNFEPLALALSDLIKTTYANWTPIITTIEECLTLCNKITNENAKLADFFNIIYGRNTTPVKYTLFSRLIRCLRELNGIQLQEVSSIHKFLFYAEVDMEAGIKKFLKRVHSPRPIDLNFIDRLICFAKRQFVLSYIDKHKIAPNFKNKTVETDQIHFCLKNNLLNQLSLESIEWWDPVIPFNCLSDKAVHNPLEVAKDKGALMHNIKFSPGDSRRELFQIIEDNNTEFNEFNLDKIPKTSEATIKRTRSNRIAQYYNYPTRLIPKEREQKIESRLFGNTTLKNKHGLSYKMLKAKKALSYFKSEMMTKSDKKRKIALHEMAQSLFDKDNYSLMLDIEGHNQSMQYDNCAKLYEFVGLLYGETNWAKLADYFAAQTIFMYDEFFDDVFISKGQKGGIEGWYNPLWTLHTTLIVEMIPFETNVELISAGIYSDDVELIAKFENTNARQLNRLFPQLQDHFLKAGMVIRMSQTSLSKNRVTLLRNHFFKGQKSDSTIKRILATSIANNGIFVSEELEISSICSTLSSSIELSEHVMTACFVKWYYISLCSLRLFAAYFDRLRDDVLWTSPHSPIKLANLLMYEQGDKYFHQSMTSEELKISFSKFLTKNGIVLDPNLTQIELDDKLMQCLGISAREFQNLQMKDLVFKQLIDNKDLRDLYFLMLTMPINSGGKGASLLINDILSGHSDGFFKQIHYLHQWVGLNTQNPRWIFDIMNNMLKVLNREMHTKDDACLCTDNWPASKLYDSSDSMIKRQINVTMRRMCNNKDIRKLLTLNNNRAIFHQHLAEIMNKDIQPRILQFYAENSVFYIMDILIKKIETSSGFCNNIKNIHNLKLKVIQNELHQWIKAMKNHDCWRPKLNKKSNILNELVTRRNLMLKNPIINNVEEPLYDHILTRNQNKGSTFVTIPSSIKTYENGKHRYKAPLFGNEALFKGEMISEDSQYDNLEEVICAKLGSVTKWLLIKNKIDPKTYFSKEHPIFIELCNTSLSTISIWDFKSLFPYLPLTTGGEIFHRLPNMRYKTNAVIRSLPSSINLYSTSINQLEINHRNLFDSNIHFDYVTQRLKLKAVYNHIYGGYKSLMTDYILEDDLFIHDVANWSDQRMCTEKMINWIPYTLLIKKNLNFNRIKQLAFSFLYHEEIDQIDLINEPKLIDNMFSNEENIILILMSKYYNDLRKNKMTLGIKSDSLTTWKPLIRILQNKYHIMTNLEDKEIHEELIELSYRIKDKYFKHLNEKQKLNDNSNIITHMVNYFSDDLDLINQYIQIINELNLRSSDSSKLDEKLFKLEDEFPYFIKLSNNRNRLILGLITDILIHKCFVYKENAGKIIIDRQEVYKMFELYTTKFIYIMKSCLLELELLDLFYLRSDPDEKNLIFTLVCDQIDESLINFNPIELDLPDIELNFKHESSSDIKIINIPNISMMKYNLERVNLEFFYQNQEIQKLTRLFKHASNLYSHPGVFNSPTGSDSLICQYGLFRKLKEIGLIKTDTNVVDLTAGRGDGHLALTQLGIIHQSYTRTDIFTAIQNINGLIHKTDYDIFKIKTLEFILNGDHIHIDISWTKHNKNSLIDLIIFLINYKKSFSIRINAISLFTEDPNLKIILQKYRFLITIPSSSTICPYQTYLIGYPNANKSDSIVEDIRSSIYYNALKQTYMKLINLPNLLFVPNINVQNSVSILLDPNQSSIALCRNLIDNIAHNEIQNRINSAIELLMKPELITMPEDYYERLLYQLHMETILYKPEKNLRELGYEDNMKVGGTSKKKQKEWELRLKEMLSKTENNVYIKSNSFNVKLLRILQYDIPNPHIRGKIICLLTIIEQFNISFPIDLDQLLMESLQIQAITDTKFNTTEKHIREAILLLYYSACVNSYAFGIALLWIQFKVNKKNANFIYKFLESYRKLSGMYHIFRNQIEAGERDITLTDKIKDLIIFPMLRQSEAINYFQEKREKLKTKTPNEITELTNKFETSIKDMNLIEGMNDFIDDMMEYGNKLFTTKQDEEMEMIMDGAAVASEEGHMLSADGQIIISKKVKMNEDTEQRANTFTKPDNFMELLDIPVVDLIEEEYEDYDLDD